MSNVTRILVLGGGFAGIECTRKLESYFRHDDSIQIPEFQNSSDVVSYVSEILHNNGIELVNAFFGQDNIVIVLHEKDAARAYEILRGEISRQI